MNNRVKGGERCPFCKDSYPTLDDLFLHLAVEHNHEPVEDLGVLEIVWHTPYVIRCPCGHIVGQTGGIVAMQRAYLDHIRAEGGDFQKHFQMAREKTLMDKIDRAGERKESFEPDDQWSWSPGSHRRRPRR